MAGYYRILELLMRLWGFRDPIEILKECIKKREWFKGVVLSTAFLEGIGKRVLSGHFEGKIAPERIEHLRSLEQIIMLLFASGLIDQPTYTKMIEVKEYRNDIVHLEPFTEPKLQPRKAKKIITKAIACLKALLEKWPKNKKYPPPPRTPKPKDWQ